MINLNMEMDIVVVVADVFEKSKTDAEFEKVLVDSMDAATFDAIRYWHLDHASGVDALQDDGGSITIADAIAVLLAAQQYYADDVEIAKALEQHQPVHEYADIAPVVAKWDYIAQHGSNAKGNAVSAANPYTAYRYEDESVLVVGQSAEGKPYYSAYASSQDVASRNTHFIGKPFPLGDNEYLIGVDDVPNLHRMQSPLIQDQAFRRCILGAWTNDRIKALGGELTNAEWTAILEDAQYGTPRRTELRKDFWGARLKALDMLSRLEQMEESFRTNTLISLSSSQKVRDRLKDEYKSITEKYPRCKFGRDEKKRLITDAFSLTAAKRLLEAAFKKEGII
ncbi:hypothetical protein MASR1M60_07670 [Rhodocyclaceae bacterium]